MTNVQFGRVKRMEFSEIPDQDDLLNEAKPTYAFNNPDFRSAIEKLVPDYAEQLFVLPHPQLSQNPDGFERWETEMVLKRQQKKPFDSEVLYGVRILYEDLYSVTQFPPGMKKFTEGMRPGGLLSHFYTLSRMDNLGIDDGLAFDWQGQDLKQALEATEDIGLREKMLTIANLISFPIVFGRFDYRRPDPHRLWMIANNPAYLSSVEELDAIGFRLIRLLQAEPALLEPMKNDEIGKELGYSRPLTRVEAYQALWRKMSRNALDNGSYKPEEAYENGEVLTDLVKIRINPEFQSLFKFISPSGYMNDQNTDNEAKAF